jgi:hypothetical protein
MPSAGVNSYPSIQSVTNLVRTWVQDDYAGATATLGEGQKFPDNIALSVTMMNCFNSALRIVCRKLRTASGPMLIFDNVLLLGVPPMQSPTGGLAVPDPSVQVSIGYLGYFNGVTMNSNIVLPSNCLLVERVWERVTGSNFDFQPMSQPKQGLPSVYQSVFNGQWEWRQDQINMVGSLQTLDLRLRYQGSLLTIYTAGVNTATTYIPINDCQDTLAAYIIKQISMRQGSSVTPVAMQWADEQINDFLNELVRREQGMPYSMQPFGGGNDGDHY